MTAPTAMRAAAIEGWMALLHGATLDQVLLRADALPSSQRATLQWLLSGALRERQGLTGLAGRLLRKPWAGDDDDLSALLTLGLYELRHGQRPAPAVVNDWVEACVRQNKPWAKGMINAVLRRYLRERATLDNGLFAAADEHPSWLLQRLQSAYPESWHAIVAANLQEPPLWLRVMPQRQARAEVLQAMTAAGLSPTLPEGLPDAIVLPGSQPVATLPTWNSGGMTVQDGSAQWAAEILAPRPGERCLDACAAPGGKTAHLLALGATNLVVLDRSATRLARVQETLTRQGLAATLGVADAALPETWWDGVAFDAILLDAPCTATGVIRRHPDILVHRQEKDLAPAVAAQHRLLEALWPLLRPGGRLLYCTCSVLPEENRDQVAGFLSRHPDALPVDDPRCGQRLPGEDDMDGFFLALLVKSQ